MNDIRNFVQAIPGTANLPNASIYVQAIERKSPIELFLRSRTEIVLAGQDSLITANPIIGRLLILGAVSAFENYCRGILSGALLMCPISQGRASDKNVNLGGAIWHGQYGNFSLSAFEHKSFADAKELKSVFKDYLNFELNESTFGELLRYFEVITHLRHAIVHSDGILPGRNAVKLDISRSNSALRVCIDQSKLQECLLILSNLVTLINRELFSQMCRRWAVEWRGRADWNPSDANDLLRAILDLFVDRAYNSTVAIDGEMGTSALRAALIAQYALD
ncbi:hypothetical protein [Sphingobium cupriresistens]|uniref:hypothetical protein n=1 Tax=Sphingobium cupriresistens TaxID=1132417 RepID=UPI000A4021EC|nr:hypothetical protein [Sphingobium cupriresistens]